MGRTIIFDSLQMGSNLTRDVTIVQGEDVPAGALIGVIDTAGDDQGKFKRCVSTATDGSQNPRAINIQDVDTTATGTNADQVATVIIKGQVRGSRLAFPMGETINTRPTTATSDGEIYRQSLRNYGIYVIDTDATVGVEE